MFVIFLIKSKIFINEVALKIHGGDWSLASIFRGAKLKPLNINELNESNFK